MSKRSRSRKSLHHATVERELRRLHEQGSVVEKQRDLIRTVLNALVLKLGGTVDLSKADFEHAQGGKIQVADRKDHEGALRVSFVPREGVSLAKLRRQRWWSWFVNLFRRPIVVAEVDRE